MDKVEELLTRGVANIIPNKEELRKLLASGKKLNVYFGIDPTSTRIHLGHTVPLRKLQVLAELGHNVTFLIGDFTALIGDTSDKDKERPALTSEQIEENFKTYKKQAEKILDFSRIKIRYNSEWLNKLPPKKIIELCQKFSLNDFIGRELIKKRIDQSGRVALHEVLYPAIQGYDSYFLDTDLQVGGTDQTFNMQAGRTLQKIWRNKQSFVLATEFLMGTDGRKMSKSWGNAIWLDDAPNDMFAKIMAINDDLIDQYFVLGTNISLEEIKNFKFGKNPMEVKKDLAKIIVTELHSEKDAEVAAENFKNIVQNKKMPTDIPDVEISENEKHEDIIEFLTRKGITESKSFAKQLLSQNGISINGATIHQRQINIKNDDIIKIGRKVWKVIFK